MGPEQNGRHFIDEILKHIFLTQGIEYGMHKSYIKSIGTWIHGAIWWTDYLRSFFSQHALLSQINDPIPGF